MNWTKSFTLKIIFTNCNLESSLFVCLVVKLICAKIEIASNKVKDVETEHKLSIYIPNTYRSVLDWLVNIELRKFIKHKNEMTDRQHERNSCCEHKKSATVPIITMNLVLPWRLSKGDFIFTKSQNIWEAKCGKSKLSVLETESKLRTGFCLSSIPIRERVIKMRWNGFQL